MTDDGVDGGEQEARRAWTWFPTPAGAVRRDRVRDISLERVDGDFEGGHTSMWFVRLHGEGLADDERLRPTFFDADELCRWIDEVFPGAAFALLPPSVVTDAPGWAPPAEPEVRFLGGHRLSDAIRTIGDGLAGGNAYEPDQGYRPPPGAPPRAI
jgi:hypothetical protein